MEREREQLVDELRCFRAAPERDQRDGPLRQHRCEHLEVLLLTGQVDIPRAVFVRTGQVSPSKRYRARTHLHTGSW